MPFVHQIAIVGVNGKLVEVDGLFDDGAMVAAMSASVFQRLCGEIGQLVYSGCKLRMANGVEVPSIGRWRGMFEIDGIRTVGNFEVFEGGNAEWDFLVGKPLLKAFDATHRYKDDTVEITDGRSSRILQN
ncbi:hypothetical protein K435DRAFT_660282, partial [Dendrothele bispora CBS 962.96]